MSARFAARALRVSSRRAFPSAPRSAVRRYASTDAHGHGGSSSDMPWIIGSALVFVPLGAWTITKLPSKDAGHGHGHDEHASTHTETPTKDDEGTEAPADEVNESAKQGVRADSPKDAQAAEEQKGGSGGAQSMTDADGETASAEDVEASKAQAFASDAPKDAQKNEESHKQFNDGPPSMDSKAESGDVEQKEKPSSGGPKPPTDMGDARKATAQEGKQPKQAEKDLK